MKYFHPVTERDKSKPNLSLHATREGAVDLSGYLHELISDTRLSLFHLTHIEPTDRFHCGFFLILRLPHSVATGRTLARALP